MLILTDYAVFRCVVALTRQSRDTEFTTVNHVLWVHTHTVDVVIIPLRQQLVTLVFTDFVRT